MIPCDYDPGSIGFHELVDRTLIAAEFFSDQVAEHPAASHLQKRINKIEKQLFKLYREAATLGVETCK